MGLNTKKIFISEFLSEFAYREGSQSTRAEKHEKLLMRAAVILFEASVPLKCPPKNIMFMFLNRAYPMYIGRGELLTRILYKLDDFLKLDLPQTGVIPLLGYDAERKRAINSMIHEMQEGKKSPNLQHFLHKYCSNYKVVYPQHFAERTRLFETLLIMLAQVEQAKLPYFVESHACEIIKAHCLFLKKYGGPIELKLGHFIGDNAMYRLRDYYAWVRTRPKNVQAPKGVFV